MERFAIALAFATLLLWQPVAAQLEASGTTQPAGAVVRTGAGDTGANRPGVGANEVKLGQPPIASRLVFVSSERRDASRSDPSVCVGLAPAECNTRR